MTGHREALTVEVWDTDRQITLLPEYRPHWNWHKRLSVLKDRTRGQEKIFSSL